MNKLAEQSNDGGATASAVAAAVASNTNKNDWPDAPTGMQSYNHNPTSAGPINDINIKLDQLMEIIQTQNCQIIELRNEMVELRKSHSNVASAAVAAAAAAASTAPSKPLQIADINTQKLELRLTRLIEEYLVRYEREHSKRLEAFLMAR